MAINDISVAQGTANVQVPILIGRSFAGETIGAMNISFAAGTAGNGIGILNTGNEFDGTIWDNAPNASFFGIAQTPATHSVQSAVSIIQTNPGPPPGQSPQIPIPVSGTVVAYTLNTLGLPAGQYTLNPNFAATTGSTSSDATLSSFTSGTLTITGTPGGNQPPVVNNQTFSVNENSLFGTFVGTVFATDPNTTPPNNTLSYSIIGGNTSNAFAINSNSGQITVNNPGVLDFETTPTFFLTVQVNDGGSPSLSDTATITVNLIDQPESTPGPSNLFVNATPGNVNEGQNVTLSGNFSGNIGNSHTVNVLWGDGQSENFTLSAGTQSFSRNHTYLDDNPSGTTQDSYQVSVTVTDQSQGLSTSNNSQSVLVRNVAPTFTTLSLNPSSVVTGQNVTISGTVTDPGVLDTHTLDIDLNGDGSFETTGLPITSGAFNQTVQANLGTGTYSAQFRVRDDDNGSSTTTRTLIVNQGGGGNQPPVVNNQTFFVNENSLFGTFVGTVFASDPNTTPPNNTLSYSIVGGNTSNAFAIGSTNGQLTVNNPGVLDFETTPTFFLTVQVNDGGSPSLSDTATITVNLIDQPESTPGPSNLFVNATPGNVNEGQNVTLSGNFSGNIGNSHTVNVLWGDGQSENFTLSAGTQSFSRNHTYLDDNPSGTTQDSYQVLVTVTDQSQGLSTSNNSQSVLVRNVAPSFATLTLNPSSVVTGQNVTISGTVTDPGVQDTHTLDIDLNGDGSFETTGLPIASGSFNQTVQANLGTGTYQAQIRVRDDDNGSSTTTRTLIVNQGGGGGNLPPVVNNQTFSVNENSLFGTFVGTVFASDPNTTPPNNTLSYSIVGGNTSNAFAIGSTNGQLTVNNPGVLDFETTPTFSLAVQVNDGGTPSLSDTAIITVNLIDQPESTPGPSNLSINATPGNVNEGQGISLSGNFTGNFGNNHTVSILWGDGQTESFTLFAGTQSFTRNHTYLDDNPSGTPQDSYQVSVTVTDQFQGLSTSNNSQSVLVRNVAPTFATLSLNPSSVVTGQNLTISGTVADAGVQDTHTLDIDLNGDGSFESTGLPITSGAFNQTVQVNLGTGTYQAQIRVRDDDGGSSTTTRTLIVNPGGGGSNQPPIVNDQTFSVNENSPFGTFVGTVLASDPNTTPPNNTLNYSIIAGNTANAFTINVTNGQLTVSNPGVLDFETTPTFFLTVRVNDGGSPSLSDTATITVNLNNLPDTTPGPSNLAVSATPTNIDEGQSVTLMGSFSGSSVSNHTVSIEWGDGQMESLTLSPGTQTFSRNHTYLDDNPTGTSQDAYQISVTVTDQSQGLSTSNNSQSVLVRNVTPSFATLSLVPSTIVVGQSVLVTGTILDGSTADTHTIDVDLNGNGTFEFTGLGVTNGSFSHSLPANLAAATYQARVRVQDDDGGAFTTTRTLVVNPGTGANLPPVVNDQTFTVNENSPFGTVVGTVFAFDPNGTPPNNTLSFSLLPNGNIGNAFAIGSANGQLTVSNPGVLDFETTPTFLLTVQVNDGGTPSLSDTATITVNLNDLPDTAPGPGSLIVNATPGTVNEGQVVTLTGSFSSTVANHTLSINWGDGQTETIGLPAGTLNFSRNHTYLDDNPTNTTQDTYSISVTVTDTSQGLSTSNNSQSVLVRNVAPSFSTLSLNPNSVTGGQNVTVSGTVTDPGVLDTHRIDIDLNGDGTFETTGLTVTSGSFSHSLPVILSTGTYQSQIRVRDDDSGSATATRTLFVNTTPGVNLPPVVNDQTFNVNENSPFGTVVGSVFASDPNTSAPNNTLSYSIVGGNTSNAFAIGSTTGQLTVNNSSVLDFETTPTFSLTVQVNDGGTPSLSDTATITINLNDLPDGPSSGLVVNVAPGTINEGQSVLLTSSFSGNPGIHTVNLIWGDGQTETFSLSAGTQSFSRNHIYQDDNPSGTTQDTYQVSVTVTDQLGISRTNSQSVLVRNVAPTFATLSVSPGTVAPGDNVVVSGTVSDPGMLDVHFVDVDLNGDGVFDTMNLPVTGGAFSQSLPVNQAAGSYQVGVRVRDDDGGVSTASRPLVVGEGDTLIEAVHLFYNNSAWDNNGPMVTTADFAAIATDKEPLHFGETATNANVSGYSRGLNAFFIDIRDLPNNGAGIDASDFMFMVGNDNTPQDWDMVSDAKAVGVFPGQGVNGSDRVYVRFADGTITDTWLWMIVKANADTGLAANGNFFYGSAPGDTGAGFSPGIVGVDAADFQSMALNLTPLANTGTEPIDEPNDVNRDRSVNAFDFQIVSLNLDTNVINLITPQLSAPGVASASQAVAAPVAVGQQQASSTESAATSETRDAAFGESFGQVDSQDGRVGSLLSSAREEALALLAAGSDADAAFALQLELDQLAEDGLLRASI